MKKLSRNQHDLLSQMYVFGDIGMQYSQINGTPYVYWKRKGISLGLHDKTEYPKITIRTLEALVVRGLVSHTSKLEKWRRYETYTLNEEGAKYLGVDIPKAEIPAEDGLYEKYRVQKTNGEPVDPAAKYFVLRLDTDAAARHAVMHYARAIMKENETLATDLAVMLIELDSGMVFYCPKCDGLGWRGPSTGKQTRCPLCTKYRKREIPV